MTTTPTPPRPRIGGGYSRGQRIGETAAVVAFFIVEAVLIARLARAELTVGLAITGFAALIAGALLSDLVSGVVHWACDTWGTIDAPVLGRLFIRQFREHHVDPQEICRHDFVETNGTNAALALIPLGILWWQPFEPDSPTLLGWAEQITGLSLAAFVTFTSQAHKWAHSSSVPRVVGWLQRARLILSPAHHAVHHLAPYRHNYSITFGWTDRWLERWRIFRHCEALIVRVTGATVQADADPNDATPERASM